MVWITGVFGPTPASEPGRLCFPVSFIKIKWLGGLYVKKQNFKPWFMLVLVCLVLSQLAFAPVSQAAGISVIINGNQLKTDVSPYIQDGRVMVPFRALFEALGATVGWDDVNKAVTGTRNGKEIKLTINDKTAKVEGKSVELDVPATITDGRTFVPLRFVGESMGADVEWDSDSQTVKVTLDAAPAPTSTTTSASTPAAVTVSKAISIKDSYGNYVVVPSPPKRVVVCCADCAQIIYALGAADSIVGISNTTGFPPALQTKDKVGASFTPSAEKIISLKPDIFFCYGVYTKQDIVDKVKRAGIPVVMIDCYKLDTMAQDVTAVGKIFGREQAAADYVNFLNKYMNLIKDRTSKLPASQKPLVYLEGYTDYTTVGPGSGGLLMLEAAGGRNLAGDYRIPSPKVNTEWVIAKNPQFIIKSVASSVPSGYGETINPMKAARKDLMNRPGWDKIKAVKSDQVYILSNEIYTGPFMPVGIAYMAKWLHPDLFQDLDPAEILREEMTKFFGLEPDGAWACP
jgi:iron complex transport system substrate-binding protein